jgi:ankyrin repeat protein
MIELFLKPNASISVSDLKGYTSLHLASKEDHFSIVELLLSANAEVPDLDQVKRAPIRLADMVFVVLFPL